MDRGDMCKQCWLEHGQFNKSCFMDCKCHEQYMAYQETMSRKTGVPVEQLKKEIKQFDKEEVKRAAVLKKILS